MERFDGLAVLSTNLRANLDEAFARRLDVLADFPQPDEEQRLALWRHCLRSEAPIADDLDLAFCAKAFELSGGNIRNIVVTAAFLAAGDGTPVTMAHLIKAVQREYKKLGRLCLEAEFGPYYPILTGAV
jgi:SpoVK/Ycf46/Vps4 family AAA+-type ATPase